MTLLVDDQVLAGLLRGRSILGPVRQPVFTTGYWYVRLCLAVGRQAGGRLSNPIAALPRHQREAATTSVLRLPREIALLSLRQLGSIISSQAERHSRMNILTREALAAAVHLHATVVLAEGNENPALLAGLQVEGLEATVVATG